MLVYDEFLKWFNKYDEQKKKEVLGDIFKIRDVSVYSVVEREDKIIFRIFASGIFYQFIFVRGDFKEESFIRVDSGLKMVVYRIYMSKGFYFDRERLLFLIDGVPIF